MHAEALKKLAPLEVNDQIPNAVKNVMLSAAEGEGLAFIIGSPRA